MMYKEKIKNIPVCCGEEMRVAGDWLHCFKCHNKLIYVHENKIKPIVTDLLLNIIPDYDLRWNKLEPIIHEIWRQGITDGEYGMKIPKDWID